MSSSHVQNPPMPHAAHAILDMTLLLLHSPHARRTSLPHGLTVFAPPGGSNSISRKEERGKKASPWVAVPFALEPRVWPVLRRPSTDSVSKLPTVVPGPIDTAPPGTFYWVPAAKIRIDSQHGRDRWCAHWAVSRGAVVETAAPRLPERNCVLYCILHCTV